MIPRRRASVPLRLDRVEPGLRVSRRDEVAVEEPLEIRLEDLQGPAKEPVLSTITMRTPGHDFELAAGLLFGEGWVSAPEEVGSMSYCAHSGKQRYNILSVCLGNSRGRGGGAGPRTLPMSSSCGLCGKSSLEDLSLESFRPLPPDRPSLDPAVLATIPDRLREGQRAFERTGGLHAAALFDVRGGLLVLREDVGRHNAVDKVVGWALLDGRFPLDRYVLAVSGRASFEIVQKVLRARIPALVAVGAPSSLAVSVARRFGITLAGFTRTSGFNLYAGAERVRPWVSPPPAGPEMDRGRRRRLLGVVLVGGRSRRFGENKALAELGGRPMAGWALEALLANTEKVVAVGGSDPTVASALGVPGRADSLPGLGPLGGVVTALEWAREMGLEGAFILACDLPLVGGEVVAEILAAWPPGSPAAVPRSPGRLGFEPLCAVYSVEALPRILALRNGGIRAMADVVAQLGVAWVPSLGPPDRTQNTFLNVNTRRDREHAERLLREGVRSTRGSSSGNANVDGVSGCSLSLE